MQLISTCNLLKKRRLVTPREKWRYNPPKYEEILRVLGFYLLLELNFDNQSAPKKNRMVELREMYGINIGVNRAIAIMDSFTPSLHILEEFCAVLRSNYASVVLDPGSIQAIDETVYAYSPSTRSRDIELIATVNLFPWFLFLENHIKMGLLIINSLPFLKEIQLITHLLLISSLFIDIPSHLLTSASRNFCNDGDGTPPRTFVETKHSETLWLLKQSKDIMH
jgi:hypothetical protein